MLDVMMACVELAVQGLLERRQLVLHHVDCDHFRSPAGFVYKLTSLATKTARKS